MTQTTTSILLILFAVLSAWASVCAFRRLRRRSTGPQRAGTAPAQHAAVALVALGCFAVLLTRWLVLGESWNPLAAHVDGLLMMCALFAGAVLFIQNRPRLRGLAAFALPLLTLMLTWATCASLWTYRPFRLETLEPAWLVFHTLCTYLGLFFCALGAVAGAMYLYVQRRLKAKQAAPGGPGGLASLETLETLIVRLATLGFVLLTLSLASGVVLVSRGGEMPFRLQWWASPKVILAMLAWAVYALLMNLRYATAFRGRYAAWLAIFGLVLLLATYGLIEALERGAA